MLNTTKQTNMGKYNFNYIFIPKHRSYSQDASIWHIDFKHEHICFLIAQRKNWVVSKYAWGILIKNKQILDIGKNSQGEVLKIAKFIDSSSSSLWHGYPADYVRKTSDRPRYEILKSWYDHGYIEKCTMHRITQGKSCNL